MIFYFSSSWSHWWYSWKNSKTDVECLRYFASQIVTLRIDQYFLLDIGNQINIIDYSNIRILKLCQLNANELDLIRADNFPHLEHLSLVKTKKFSLKALCQFKLLRSCQLRSLDIDTQDSNSSSIQSMHIQQCFLWDVSIILRHFPEMIFFKTCISLFNDPAVKSKPFIKFLHTNLRTFRIDFLDIDCWTNDTDHDKYNDIFEFLTSISFNKHIRYYLSLINTKNFNFEQFQHIVRQLNFVHFSCRLIWLHKYQSSPNIDSIRQIPLFNQLQIIWSGAIGTICRTTWTNTSISSY